MTIFVGDAFSLLAAQPNGKFGCCITSPPYYGLKGYGSPGQIGQEASIQEYVTNVVAVMREVRRTLRDDGVAWFVIGDSRVAQGGAQVTGTKQVAGSQDGAWGGKSRKPPPGLKPKDMALVPERLAIALQEDGWWLRNKVVWEKPNVMPSKAKDRFTDSYEVILLLAKSERYAFRQQIEVAVSGATRNARDVWRINTRGFPGAHFATFPEELVATILRTNAIHDAPVLDPFCGSGTTGVVAQRLGFEFVGIELNPEYAAMAEARLRTTFINQAKENQP